MSKVGFAYDEGSIQGTDAPVQHDNTNYITSFIAGRANLTSVKRYDTSPGSSVFVTSSMFYNTSGSVVKAIDPANHQTQFSYADQFSANGATLDAARPATFAYATMVTDPDGYTANSRYHFDFGAVTWKQTPQPNTIQNLPGPEQTFTYDSLGRIQRSTNLVNGAYTRYVYPSIQTVSQNRIDVYATIVDGASEQNGNEAHSFKVFDGHGRVVASASSHPGSIGGFSGQLVLYDNLGRAIKQSNPTETSASGMPSQWAASGDDVSAGWLYTQQTYDWKGRPLVTTNTDSTTKEASYSGCGCAGGQIVTLTDEGTMDAGVAKRRQQNIYADVLGRTVKTEILNWQGGTVYATTVNTYNARDQITRVGQYQGTDTSTVHQDTVMSYDGYGRLKTKHAPEQQLDPNNSASIDHTTWDYNTDDTIQKTTDARGAIATFSYNNRGLVTNIAYSLLAGVPSTGQSAVALSSPVSFAYDAAGNRTSMTDSLGGTTYAYNQLSRMTSETRAFNTLGSFTLSYDYNLAGQLKKITDAANTTINYAYDSVGRVSGITGSDHLVGGISNYASGLQYRAWGALKQVSAGPSHTSSIGYNSRLQVNHFDVSGGVANQNFDYFADGTLSFLHNTVDTNFDRSFAYDHVGRLTAAAAGGAARHDSGVVPMNETFQCTPWNDISQRFTETWLNDFFDSGTYLNGRRVGWGYDAEGRIASVDTRSYTYNAGGQNISLSGQRSTINGNVPVTTNYDFDGDGNKVRQSSSSSGTVTTYYYLRSSVLGTIVEELNSSGQERFGYVYTPAGDLLARQVPGLDYVSLKPRTPVGSTQYEFFMSNTSTGLDSRIEFDPLGAPVPLSSHSFDHVGDPGTVPEGIPPADSQFPAIQYPAPGCTLDGVWVPCSLAFRGIESGSVGLDVIRKKDRDGRIVPDGRWFRDYGLGLYGVYLPDGARDNDLQFDLYLFSFAESPQNSGGEFQHARRTRSLFSSARLEWCLRNLFTVKFSQDQISQQEGSFGFDSLGAWFKGMWVDKPIDVRTDMVTYNLADVALMHGKPVGTVGGFTDKRHPYTNFLASDLLQRGYDFENLRAAWVHELGNSLAAITGQPRQAKLPGMLAWDKDSGNALEECVYGGKVVNNTTITTDPGRR